MEADVDIYLLYQTYKKEMGPFMSILLSLRSIHILVRLDSMEPISHGSACS
jgi:hypothetical protein